ncbi:MAG: hydrogenase 3 maturation endopeptidase HyCI [Candidatus Omnitrophota bacterium]|jgi:hydrogenase 3 maturation protease
MQSLKKKLKNKLTGARRIAVLGVGSDICSDDVAGMRVASLLEAHLKKRRGKIKFKFFAGGTAPENFTGEIKKFKPSHLIIIDCADFGKKPGVVSIFGIEDLGGITFSTHRLPANIMADYLMQSVQCGCLIVGIQPKTLKFGESLSKEVSRSVDSLVSLMGESLSTL